MVVGFEPAQELEELRHLESSHGGMYSSHHEEKKAAVVWSRGKKEESP